MAGNPYKNGHLYYTSLLASSCCRYDKWSLALAHKILRYLKGTKHLGILITAQGTEEELDSWSDAGYAGVETKSQSGLVIVWAGTIIAWRSSKQTVSALNTAEAELVAATLGWQVIEGIRRLLCNFGIEISKSRLYIDNQAALTIAMCGASWRTRYFATRGHRLQEEYLRGAAELVHCPTAKMVADCLTKLATAPVIQVTHDAMEGKLPEGLAPRNQARHVTSVTPGRCCRGDIAGDGPTSEASSKKEKATTGEDTSFLLSRVPCLEPAADAEDSSFSLSRAPCLEPAADAEAKKGIRKGEVSSSSSSSAPNHERAADAEIDTEDRNGQLSDVAASKKRRGKKRTRPGSTERKWSLLEATARESTRGHPEAGKSSHDEGST